MAERITWTSVVDRLPEITDPASGDKSGGFSNYVLVWPYGLVEPDTVFATYSEKRARFETPTGEPLGFKVTHWRELPSGP